MKRTSRYGKPFYATLSLCCTFLLAISGVCLFIGLHSIDVLGKQAQNSMMAALEINMTYISAQRAKISLSDLAASLDEDGLLTEMGKATVLDAESVAEMEGRLNELWKSFPDSVCRPYLYFTQSDYAMGCEASGTDVRRVIGDLIFSDIADPQIQDALYSDTKLLCDDKGQQLAVRSRLVAGSVYFLYVTYADPTTAVSSELLASLCEPEMYYYDRYGHAGACQQERTLMDLYDYYSLGSAESGSFSFEYQGKIYNCQYAQVSDSETRFAVFAVDRAQMASRTLLRSALLLVGLMLFLGTALAFVFARRMYRPIQNLMLGLKVEETNGMRDDFHLLREALDSRDSAIASQKEQLTRIAFLRLLAGTGADNVREVREQFFFCAADASFVIAAIRPDNDSEETVPVENTAVELFFRNQGVDTLCAHDARFLICAFDLRKAAFEKLLTLCEKLHAYYRDRNVAISVFLSDVHTDGPSSLRTAYAQALQLAEFCCVIEKYDTVISYDMVRKQMNVSYGNVLDYGQLEKLTCAVGNLCADDALELFDRISRRILLCKEASHSAGALCLPILRNAICLALHEIGLYNEALQKAVAQYEQELLMANGFPQLRSALKTAMETLVDRSAHLRSDNGRFEQIKSYVLEHCLEPYLNAGAVADIFGTSQSNITRMFKKYNHTGFLEYLNMLRVEKAKSLLSSTDYTLTDISAMAGYTNTLTMTRAFKRYAGTTPGNFRAVI